MHRRDDIVPHRLGALSALLLVLVAAAACAGSPRSNPPSRAGQERGSKGSTVRTEQGKGVYHVVLPGQTLWRIARTYGVDPDRLARVNDIDDPTRILAGARIFVPGARRVLDVAPPGIGVDTPTYPELAGDWTWPVDDGVVVSLFGERRGPRTHKGLDIAGDHGEPVVAARAGKVLYSDSGLSGYGRTVILDHGDGLRTLYAHNSKLLVKPGERVRRGQIIARVGRTGNATGDHCHFELRRSGVPIDPLPMFAGTLRSERR